MSATSGPRTLVCTHSPIANTIATPTRRLVAASSEWVSVAGSTASRLTAKSALAAAKACERRIRVTTRTAGICAKPGRAATFAGGFTVDPGSLCLADIRDLAQPIIDKWVRRGELELTRGVLSAAPQSAAIGLPAALAAVNQGAVAHLLIGHGGTVPGFACGHCGTLNVRRSNGRSDTPSAGCGMKKIWSA